MPSHAAKNLLLPNPDISFQPWLLGLLISLCFSRKRDRERKGGGRGIGVKEEGRIGRAASSLLVPLNMYAYALGFLVNLFQVLDISNEMF